MAVRYTCPLRRIQYDAATVLNPLVEAKATVKALKTTPYQRDWVDKLQALQFKMEVAGTSRIEGAEFINFILPGPEPARTTAFAWVDARSLSHRKFSVPHLETKDKDCTTYCG